MGSRLRTPDSNYLMTAGSWQQLTRLSTTISASDAGRGEAIATEAYSICTRAGLFRVSKSALPRSHRTCLPSVLMIGPSTGLVTLFRFVSLVCLPPAIICNALFSKAHSPLLNSNNQQQQQQSVVVVGGESASSAKNDCGAQLLHIRRRRCGMSMFQLLFGYSIQLLLRRLLLQW